MTYSKRVIKDLADAIADQSTIGGILPRKLENNSIFLKMNLLKKPLSSTRFKILIVPLAVLPLEKAELS